VEGIVCRILQSGFWLNRAYYSERNERDTTGFHQALPLATTELATFPAEQSFSTKGRFMLKERLVEVEAVGVRRWKESFGLRCDSQRDRW
jgi:hypothetical protein